MQPCNRGHTYGDRFSKYLVYKRLFLGEAGHIGAINALVFSKLITSATLVRYCPTSIFCNGFGSFDLRRRRKRENQYWENWGIALKPDSAAGGRRRPKEISIGRGMDKSIGHRLRESEV